MENNSNNKKQEVGALWERKSKAGKKFLSGTITVNGEQIEVIGFANTYKKPGEKSPDWRFYLSEPLEASGKQQTKQAPKKTKPADEVSDVETTGGDEEEIPF